MNDVVQTSHDRHITKPEVSFLLSISDDRHTEVFKFSGCLKTDPKLENNSFRAPETMNYAFRQNFWVT